MELMSLIVVASALFVYWDCTRNHIGKIPGEKGLLNNSAGVWATGTVLLWVLVLPLYLFNRKKLKKKAVASPQVISSLKRGMVFGILVLVSLLTVTGQFAGSIAPDNDALLTDVSGVWQASDETMVTIDLANPSGTILIIQEEIIPVTVEQVDQENNVVVLMLTLSDEKEVWSIQKEIQEDESFFLRLTLSDGKQHTLTFVRNIL